MLNYVNQTGFARHREKMKIELLRMMGKVGVIGVLELISEVAENSESSTNPENPFTEASSVAFWQMTAAHTKELSEKLFHEHCSK